MPERLRLDDAGDDEEHEKDAPVVAMVGRSFRDARRINRLPAGARRHALLLDDLTRPK